MTLLGSGLLMRFQIQNSIRHRDTEAQRKTQFHSSLPLCLCVSVTLWLFFLFERQLHGLAGSGRFVGGEDQLVGFNRVVQVGEYRLVIEDAADEGFDLAIEWVMGDVAGV